MTDVPPQSATTAEPEDGSFAAAKARDAALILPIVGLLLFIPPLIGIFASDSFLFGTPVIVAYIFTSWAVLIVCAGILSRHLKRAAQHEAARAPDSGP